MKRLRQIVTRAGDGHVLFLHRLKQSRLRTRAGAVDLVGHQKLGEHRTRQEAEAAFAGLAFLEHFGAEDVGGHQIGRELDTPRIEAEHGSHCVDQLGLGETRHAEQQRVASGQNGNQRLLDDFVLAEYDVPDRGFRGAHMIGAGFRRADDHVFEFLESLAADSGHVKLLIDPKRDISPGPDVLPRAAYRIRFAGAARITQAGFAPLSDVAIYAPAAFTPICGYSVFHRDHVQIRRK